jgi:hypothetical protein
VQDGSWPVQSEIGPVQGVFAVGSKTQLRAKDRTDQC